MTTINELDAGYPIATLEEQLLALGSTLERIVSIENLPGSWSVIAQPYDSIGGYQYRLVDSTKTKVYTKHFTGSLMSTLNYTAFDHGLDVEKILDVRARIMSSGANYGPCSPGAGNSPYYNILVDNTHVEMQYLSTVYASGTYIATVTYTE